MQIKYAKVTPFTIEIVSRCSSAFPAESSSQLTEFYLWQHNIFWQQQQVNISLHHSFIIYVSFDTLHTVVEQWSFQSRGCRQSHPPVGHQRLLFCFQLGQVMKCTTELHNQIHNLLFKICIASIMVPLSGPQSLITNLSLPPKHVCICIFSPTHYF